MTSKIATRNYFLVFIALFAIVLIPFALCSPLPLADSPNHAARIHIIANISHSADLARYYLLDWTFVPNLAMDILLPPLLPWLSAEQSMVLFSGLTLFLIASGAVMVNRALYGRWSFAPFLIFLLLYNRQFLWGILNYLFTVGLLLWTFAGHVYFRDRAPVIARVVAFSIISMILMLFHLHAFACYAIVVGCYEISIAWRAWRATGVFPLRELVIPALQFIAPVVMFFTLSSTVKRAGETEYSGISSKINGLVEIFNNYNVPFDIATFVVVMGLLVVGLYTKRISIHPNLRLPLIVLFLIALIMPDVILASYLADRRLMVFVSFLLVAAMDIRLQTTTMRAVVASALGVLFVARMAVVAVNWHHAQPVYDRIIAAIDMLPVGSRVAVLAGTPQTPSLPNPPVEHMINLAVIRKDAFVNSLFAEPGQQPLRLRDVPSKDFAASPSHSFRLTDPSIGKMDPFERVRALERFDYVMMINESIFASKRPPELLPVYRKDLISLFKVVPQSPQASR